MTEDQIKLLTDWAEALEALDKLDWRERGFSMEDWALNKPPETPALGCGTACCAYGVGTTLASWRAAGLGLTRWTGNDYPIVKFFPHTTSSVKPYVVLGLSGSNWEWITDPYFYQEHPISPGSVALRIREVLDEAATP